MAPTLMRWLRLAAAALAVAAVASACRVDAVVDVVVDDQGTGLVKVRVVADAEAVRLVPDLPDGLRLTDVVEAGWDVIGPETNAEGGLAVEASKAFESAEQLPEILAELAGEGIFEDVSVTRTHASSEFNFSLSNPVTASRTTYELSGRVVPPSEPAVFSDDSLIAVLGDPFGRPELIDEFGRPVDPTQALGMALSFTLPLNVGSETADEVDGGRATWTFAFGDDPFAIDALGAVDDPIPRRWLAGAVAAVVAFVLVVLLQLVWWVLNTLRTPKGRRRRATRRRATRRRRQRDADGQVEAVSPRRRLLRLLVVDVHGVIVRPTDPLEGLLLPTILHERPDIDPDLVRDRHRKLVLGRLTPDEFWSDLGLGPVAEEIETRYLSSFRLVPGLHPFLDRMGERRLPVAAVGNQPRPWGERLRRMASLEDSVASWLVSGDVGATLPEPSLLEATRRTMSVDIYDCLYLSSVPEHLDAAAEVGMATAYFAASPADVLETSHTMVRGFSDILRGRAGNT